MLNKVDDSKYIFKFSTSNSPAITVSSGSTVVIDTMDCFSNQLQTPADRLDSIDWNRINPATGPVFIAGAMPKDVLKVTIEDILINSQGVMASGKDLGILGNYMEGVISKLIPINDGYAIFDDKLSIPIKPMIGVIGVALDGEDINCGTPGPHGGNMDNAMIAKGSVLYLPVFAEGALFALGDLHAVMGDGEIGVTGIEVAGSVCVKFEVIKGFNLSNPLLENTEYISTIASSETLDNAVNTATIDMAQLLSKKLSLSMHDIAMLMSIIGHTQICQVVDPLKTARYVIPKWVLEKYNFSL